MTTVLVLGASGMLGSMMYKILSSDARYSVYGTMRDIRAKSFFNETQRERIIVGVDVLNQDSLLKVLSQVRPHVVVNCIGLVKQLSDANDPLVALPINSMLPHRLANYCKLIDSRLIHISTDCVFSGKKGGYVEADVSDAYDIYGRSKYIGEVHDAEHVITLRTSIIGHELNSSHSLVDWFLSQHSKVNGYSKAVFSGVPTVELAKIVAEYVLPNQTINGLYHVSAEPIDKCTLLKIISEVYKKQIEIVESSSVVIDRSLNSDKFRSVTGYIPGGWKKLIELMYSSR